MCPAARTEEGLASASGGVERLSYPRCSLLCISGTVENILYKLRGGGEGHV